MFFSSEFYPDGLFTNKTLQFLNPTVPVFAILCYILFFGYNTPRIGEWKTFKQHVLKMFKTNQKIIWLSLILLIASMIYMNFHKLKAPNDPNVYGVRLMNYVLSQMFCTILFLYLQLTRNIVGEMEIFG